VNSFRRCGDLIVLNGEEFNLSDLIDLYPKYGMEAWKIHYYDGRKHYVSDGRIQSGMEVPYDIGDGLFNRIPELRMCREQRLIDTQHLEHLRNGRR
jgi:hypothetical protein